MATLTWNGSVATITPIALTTPVATTTIGSTTGAALPTGSWVPLNGGPIPCAAETVAAAPSATSNIVGVEFVATGATGNVVLGGANPVLAFAGATATITVNPTDLGIGARSIIVEQVDVFGNTSYTASTPLTLTVGDIPLYAGTSAQPILAEGIDTKNAIRLFGPSAAASSGSVCSPASKMFAQPFDQPVSGSTAVGTVVDGATNFCIDALYETFESTGVYGVKADGSAIARFDGVAAETLNFITAPTSPNKVQFRRIEPNSITGAAMAIDDLSGNGWFGNATKGTGD